MATEITCIVADSDEPESRIEKIGGPGWKKTESYAIAEAEHFRRRFYIESDSSRVPVVVEEADGRKYLRTDPAVTSENELLSLPPCPS